MNWYLKSESVPQSVTELRELLLANRQIADPNTFFQPVSPLELELASVDIDAQQVSRAIERIWLARQRQEDVMVFGDYDADGVCSTTVLWETLYELGIKARPFIPHREKHGYGMSERSLAEILATKKPDLIITVDNGIVALEPVKQLQAVGVDVIITDHHAPEVVNGQVVYPAALAIVHSTKLCGTTVAWMLVRELIASLPKSGLPETEWRQLQSRLASKPAELLDVCAIATIADQVLLTGANRSFAQSGLAALRHTTRLGLQKLLERAEIPLATITTSSIHFGIAPRINAMGRLEHSLDALRLLCTKSPERAEQLAGMLSETNVRRQGLTSDMVDHAKQQVKIWQDEHILVVASETYHEGVIGLIAGKLMEEFYKPAIAIAIGEHSAKASARSIPGVNIVELIRLVRHDLLEVGGHPMAAGFSLTPQKIDSVRQQLHVLAKSQISVEQLTPKIDIECIIPYALVSENIVAALKDFEPFGQGNPEPIFGLQQLKVLDAFTMGSTNQHLKLVVSAPTTNPNQSPTGPTTLNVISWHKGHLASQLTPGTLVDLAGILEINEWKGRTNLQFRAKDVVVG